LAQVVVETSLGVQMRHFLDSGLVSEHDCPAFIKARDAVVRLRGSVVAESLIAIVAIGVAVTARVFVAGASDGSTWEKIGKSITPAGWWYAVVSLPILFFLLFRWCWIFVLWSWFLVRVSRFDLELTPTHPDRAGGLGFLGWGVASFSLILMAISAVLSGSFAREILHRGSTLSDLKYHVVIFVVIAIVVLHAPLLAFVGKLARCRFRGLLSFGSLILRHDLTFEEKWLRGGPANWRQLTGSPDASSLADIGAAFEHIERMQFIPIDKKALIALVASALLPLFPLVGTSVSLSDVLAKLAEFMA
jgi:hypothetical protein